jgi:hypothetical protein
MPMRRVCADAGMIDVSAAHSAPVGNATGSPCLKHAPALLAQYNAAARAFRSRSSGLFAGHSELHTGSPPCASTCSQISLRSA